MWVTLARHTTPLYAVETDLIGEYIPAARDLAAGHLRAEHYQFHGFGYPLLLAGVGRVCGGDLWLAARLLNVAAAAAGAAAAFALVAGFLGGAAGFVALLALLVNPVFVRATLEAVTDMPSFALAIGATWLLLRPSRPGASPRATAGVLAAGGFLAAFALITRYNNAFLLVAAALVLLARPSRWRDLGAYAAGALLPIGAWLAASRAMAGDPLGHLNYMNVAYELYGRGMNWDRFWEAGRAQFHSLGDVLTYDPRALAAHVGINLAARWLADAHQLMPVWLGALAVPGMLLSWRRPGWRALLLHSSLCYLVLALVFYSPRFFLYLLPFYLSGAAGLLLLPRLPFVKPSARHAPSWIAIVRVTVIAGLFAASAVSAFAGARRLLAAAPEETRLAGPVLRRLGASGQTLMARKPHAAYFAGMRHVPMPDVNAFEELIAGGRESGARFLFFSGIESRLRPQFALLLDEGVHLPGLEPLAWEWHGPLHSFAIYRFTGERPDSASFGDSLLSAIHRFTDRRPGEAWPHTYMAGHLINRGRPGEAIEHLALAERLSPNDVVIARMQAVAWTALGEFDRAAASCERAIALGSDDAWEEANLGRVRLLQGRYAEARERLANAVRLEPTNPQYAHALGVASFHAGDRAGAIEVFERLLASHPEYDEARLYVARARSLAGDRAGALRVLEPALARGAAPELHSLADSLRRGMRPR